MSRHTLLGRSLHPMLQASIDRYFAAGYTQANFPTIPYIMKVNKFLFDIQGYGLINGLTSIKLEWLYFFLPEAASVDFGRINLVRPSFSLCSGSPNFLSKNGIGDAGALMDTQFAPDSHLILGTSVTDFLAAVWSKVGGTNVGSTQDLMLAQGPNGRLITIRARTNPRTDGLLNLTVASPTVIQTGNTTSNTIYGMMTRSSTGYSFVNGTETLNSTGNTFPDGGATVRYANAMHAGKYVGGGWGGKALSTTELANMNTAIQAFSASL